MVGEASVFRLQQDSGTNVDRGGGGGRDVGRQAICMTLCSRQNIFLAQCTGQRWEAC